jgi:hypothetical protein
MAEDHTKSGLVIAYALVAISGFIAGFLVRWILAG